MKSVRGKEYVQNNHIHMWELKMHGKVAIKVQSKQQNGELIHTSE